MSVLYMRKIKVWIPLVFVVTLLVRQITFLNLATSSSSIQPTGSDASSSSHRIYEEISFTNVGWFHPNPRVANQTKRTIVARELMEAVQAHERFRLSAWTDSTTTSNNNSNNNSSSKPLLVFLDFDACATCHYPLFGGGDGKVNADTLYGRPAGHPRIRKVCHKVDLALSQHSPALRHPDSRLVVLSCNENQHTGMVVDYCLNKNRDMTWYYQLVVGHMSAASRSVHPQIDFGLPPWPVKQAHLTDQQWNDLRKCVKRPIELSFKGRPREDFPEFFQFFEDLRQKDPNSTIYKLHFSYDHYSESPLEAGGFKQLAPTPMEKQAADPYYVWMMNSTFCLTPRGDNIYSVRFSEVMSAGCIPIVYGDDWVLPYNSEIVPDWNSLVVMIPQKDVNSTLDIISQISQRQRCTMQNNVVEFFHKYVKDSPSRIRAIVALMDARLNHGLVNVSYIPG